MPLSGPAGGAGSGPEKGFENVIRLRGFGSGPLPHPAAL